jgi:hypothetical protein
LWSDEERLELRIYSLGFLVRPEIVLELMKAAELRHPDGTLQLGPNQGRVLYWQLEGEGNEQRVRLLHAPRGGCSLGSLTDALYDATLGMASAACDPCEQSLYKGKNWGYSSNVSVISEARLLWKMARGKGEVSTTDADFRAAEKAVRTGDAAVPVGARSRALSGAGVHFDPQQEPFLLATVQRANEMAERRQRGQRQRQQPNRQRQRQQPGKQRQRQQPGRQRQRQQPGRQQQEEEEEEEEGEEEGEEEAMVPMRQQPARRCKRSAQGQADESQQAAVDPGGGDEAAIDARKRARS